MCIDWKELADDLLTAGPVASGTLAALLERAFQHGFNTGIGEGVVTSKIYTGPVTVQIMRDLERKKFRL
jgi:hypothetical protein